MRDKIVDDDVLFDRLVDGELSAAERRRLLASLNDRPDGWRRCALRFLEAQSWSEDLRHLMAKLPPDAPITSAATSRFAGVAPSRVVHKRAVSWLAIAAGLLFAFTLGLVMRNGGGAGGGSPLAIDVAANPDRQTAEVVPTPADAMDGRKADDALTLFVSDEGGQVRPLRVPLVDAQQLDEQLGLQFQTGVPTAVRDNLQDRGFDVQTKRRYAPLWLEDGRSMFVPVEDTRIVPVSRKVY